MVPSMFSIEGALSHLYEHTSHKHIDNWALHIVECPLLFDKINVLTTNKGAFYFFAIQW